MASERALVLSCEHASNAVPARYRPLFRGAARVLESHRGWDPGALTLARRFGRATGIPVHAGRATRLLVDLNRSPHHRKLHSEYLDALPEDEKARIRQRHYAPYRLEVEAAIERATRASPTLHLSFHSFTPILDGVRRRADFGILYDPSRASERRFADDLTAAIAALDPELRVRRNYPYRGTADGLIPHLRHRFSDPRYAGIELELNQRFPLGDPSRWRQVQRMLTQALSEVTPRAKRKGT